jgi:hypothetical protein
LGQISARRVISRTSVMPYKRTRQGLPQTAQELNVDAAIRRTGSYHGGINRRARGQAANLARACAASGRRNEAVQLLTDLTKRSSSGYSSAAEIATIYAALGDRNLAMKWLEKAYEERFNPSVLLRSGFDPLRSDTRLQNLVRRIGLKW